MRGRHAADRTAFEPGITERPLWSHLHQANIELGGEWIETRLLTSGPRTNPWYQECSARVIENGDIVSFDSDLVGAHGYSADISRSWIARRPACDERTTAALCAGARGAPTQHRAHSGWRLVSRDWRESLEAARALPPRLAVGDRAWDRARQERVPADPAR